MKKGILIIGAVFLLTSCDSEKKLYSWQKYEVASYNYLKYSDEKSLEDLIANYKLIISKQKGSRKTVPPGIYADYGFILLQSGKTEEGSAMLQKEIELYPESKIFIDRILKMSKT